MVQIPQLNMVLLSHVHRDSEEDTELSCARGGCLAGRTASCSCELLTEGRPRRAGWRRGGRGWGVVIPTWPDRQTSFLLPLLQQWTCPGPQRQRQPW